MSLIQIFLKELNAESATTRKMLQRIPDDQYDWKPHEKSMDIRALATHIAELPTWTTMALTTDELDFATMDYKPVVVENTAQLMELFESALLNGRTQLVESNEPRLNEAWILRTGDNIHLKLTRAEMIRVALSQIIHHRAQLGVYLRLLNIPIPGSYGPSADENDFQAQETTTADV